MLISTKQWGSRIFLLGVLRGAQQFTGGAKKLIKLIESNERLNVSYIQQLRKRHVLLFFPVVLNLSYATVSNNYNNGNCKI